MLPAQGQLRLQVMLLMRVQMHPPLLLLLLPPPLLPQSA
jgi:hypothetical protein